MALVPKTLNPTARTKYSQVTAAAGINETNVYFHYEGENENKNPHSIVFLVEKKAWEINEHAVFFWCAATSKRVKI